MSSPRLWGWPVTMQKAQLLSPEFPTPVGMARHDPSGHYLRAGVPHACGDGPRGEYDIGSDRSSSPRLWGWPASAILSVPSAPEFPTPVGMARPHRAAARRLVRVPHACGDGPLQRRASATLAASSPRLWGWPGLHSVPLVDAVEFPTPVGMARVGRPGSGSSARVPHACGDGPTETPWATEVSGSSPRLWGWPDLGYTRQRLYQEFPTPVGMARRGQGRCGVFGRVPHACGDGPRPYPLSRAGNRSSPRLWGWPAQGGRGDDLVGEFPTPVGMARDGRREQGDCRRVPHACGDGPQLSCYGFVTPRSSPRLWGWPATLPNPVTVGAEFPTPVGMARAAS